MEGARGKGGKAEGDEERRQRVKRADGRRSRRASWAHCRGQATTAAHSSGRRRPLAGPGAAHLSFGSCSWQVPSTPRRGVAGVQAGAGHTL